MSLSTHLLILSTLISRLQRSELARGDSGSSRSTTSASPGDSPSGQLGPLGKEEDR